VVCGVRGHQLRARNGANALILVPGALHKDLRRPTREHGVLEDALDPSEGFFDRGASRRSALVLVVHAEDAVVFG